MKPITKSDIPARFLFILDMYGATERFIGNIEFWNLNPRKVLQHATSTIYLSVFIYRSFRLFDTSEGWDYWEAIANQNESEIFRLTKFLNENP